MGAAGPQGVEDRGRPLRRPVVERQGDRPGDARATPRVDDPGARDCVAGELGNPADSLHRVRSLTTHRTMPRAMPAPYVSSPAA